MNSLKIVSLMALISIPVAAVADAGQQHASPTDQGSSSTAGNVQLTNDTNNYNGDHLWWRKAVRASKTPGGPLSYCIPAHTFLIGQESNLASDTESATYSSGSNAGKGAKLTGQWLQVRLADTDFPWAWREQPNFQHTDANISYVGPSATPPEGAGNPNTDENKSLLAQATVECSQFENSSSASANTQPETAPTQANTSGGASSNAGGSANNAQQSGQPKPAQFENLATGQFAYVSADDLPDAHRAGWEYGALAVPFKLQTSQGGTITSATSLGPYLGYRVRLTDSIVLSPVGFVGAAPVTVSTTKNGTSSSQQLAAISYGGGFVFTIKDSFQAGIIIGADHVNPNSNYPYNDKLWVSFALGYSFAK